MTGSSPHTHEEWVRGVERDLRQLRVHRHAPPVPAGVDPTPQVLMAEAIETPMVDSGVAGGDATIYEQPADTGAPRQPSQAQAEVRLGVVTLTWDGLAAGGLPMSDDTQLVRIHREQQRPLESLLSVTDEQTPANEDFQPTAANYVGRVLYPGPGSLVMPDQPYNTLWYYRLVAVDRDGNESAPSQATAVMTLPLVETDIIGQVLNGANFMDGTIDTAALADGSVSGEKIAAASIDPSKLNFVIEPGTAGGNFSFYQATEPTQRPDASALGEGDLWFDVDDNFRIHRYTGGVWLDVKDVTVEDGAVTADAIAAGAVIAGKIGAGAVIAGTIDAEAVTAGTIAAGAVGADEIAAGSIVAGKLAVAAVTASSIAALAISSDKIAANAVTAAKIAVGAVAASKISTGELAAGVVIYAGPSNDTHAEVTSDGIAAYVADAIDGVPNLSVRFGSSINGDVFGVVGVSGDFVATISDEGVVSAAGASIDNDLTVKGHPLVGLQGDTLYDLVDFVNNPVAYDRDLEVNPIGIIEQYAKGDVANCQFSPSAFTVTASGGLDVGLFELGFDLEAGRRYYFETSNMLVDMSSGPGTVGLILRYTTDGSTPNLSSSIAEYDYKPVAAGGLVSLALASRAIDGGAVSQSQVRFLVCLYATGGTASLTGPLVNARIHDAGPIKTATGVVRNLTSGTPAVAAPKAWTKTYTSTSSATYKGDGTRRTDTGGDVVQGYNSFNGDGEGLWLFPSMTADLASVTVTKVEAYIYFNHWHYNSGGIALINSHNHATAPTSNPTQTRRSTVAGWPKPGGQWVVLPSAVGAGLKAGTIKGIGIGPAASTDLVYYGRANSVALLRVSGTK